MTVVPEGTIRLNINVEEKLHSAFKAIAALEGRRMTDLIIEFMESYVREHGGKLPRKGKKE